ncbi:TPA: hypothetical protein ACXE8V_003399 [Pluralibacter gergoviae]
MANKYLKDLHSNYYRYKQQCGIGIYIILAGIFFIIANAIWNLGDSKILQGVVLGGGIVFWGINWDRYTSVKNELNRYCREHFGKDYSQSIPDVIKKENSDD